MIIVADKQHIYELSNNRSGTTVGVKYFLPLASAILLLSTVLPAITLCIFAL